jgi:hypothetical protein
MIRTKKEENMEDNKKMLSEKDVEKVGGGNGAPYDFDHEHCPRCGSENIRFEGFIADGELATYFCPDCHFYIEEIA